MIGRKARFLLVSKLKKKGWEPKFPPAHLEICQKYAYRYACDPKKRVRFGNSRKKGVYLISTIKYDLSSHIESDSLMF